MKHQTPATASSVRFNLSQKVAWQLNLPVVNVSEISAETVALLTLANAEPADKSSLVELALNQEPRLVRQRPSTLFKELDNKCLHTHSEKEKIVTSYCGKSYRPPIIWGQALFVPFDGPSKHETDWYNILLIRQIEAYRDRIEGINDTLLTFEDGQQLLLPRRLEAVLPKVGESFNRAHFYFYLYDLVMDGDQQRPSPTLPLIEAKLKELSLKRDLHPGGAVINEALAQFKKSPEPSADPFSAWGYF